MKYYLWLLCILFCTGLQAQIAKLEEFAKGGFFSSSEIKDDNNNVRGYFLLFEADKLAKETYMLEYVLLDENLARVTSGFITEEKYDRANLEAKNVGVKASLYGNKLLLEMCDNFEYAELYKRYRLLDIKTFEMTEPFISKNGKIINNPKFERKRNEEFEGMTDEIVVFKNIGLVAYSPFIKKGSEERRKYLTHYDENLNVVWEYVYDDKVPGKGKYVEQKFVVYAKSDANLLTLIVMGTRNNTKVNDVLTVHFVDPATGKLLKEAVFPEGDKAAFEANECILTKDEIIITGIYRKGGEQWMNEAGFSNDGMYRHTYSRHDFALTEVKKLGWKEILGHEYTLDKRNLIDGEGSVFIHDVLPLSNGGMVAACEVYGVPIITFDIFFLEFSPDFTLNQIFIAEKFKTKFSGWIYNIADFPKYGVFDYVDYQDLGDDEMAFLFLDNEKAGTDRKFTNKYGIVSYSEGKFARQTLELETPGSSRNIVNAKKGYILVQENFRDKKKQDEMRLEKINY